jgi:hypothetical protein
MLASATANATATNAARGGVIAYPGSTDQHEHVPCALSSVDLALAWILAAQLLFAVREFKLDASTSTAIP